MAKSPPTARVLTPDERFALMMTQDRLFEQARSITRIIERGTITAIGRRELMHGLKDLVDRMEGIAI